MKKSRIFIIAILALLFISAENKDYRIAGVVESIRNDGYITVLLENTPDADEYLLLNNNIIIGTVNTLQFTGYANGKMRYLAVYAVRDESAKKLLKAGMNISLKMAEKIFDKRAEKTVFQEKPVYKPVIISYIDKREMVLIPAGKFMMGSSDGDDDEYPEQMVFVNEYYIDKFEVSNEDYRIYAERKSLAFPEYWKNRLNSNGEFTDLYFSRLPVIVSYHEAENYARWAGKRLPDEREWEKAARLPASSAKDGRWSRYTWGNIFKDGISNTKELWVNEKTGENLKAMIKNKYGLIQVDKGLIPVDIYENESVSFYGVIHMDGNAPEWTGSWYRAYLNNKKPDKRYGTQFKVIRGGAFNLGEKESRVTDRKLGGFPDLYRDRIAGFRCVKNVTDNDKN